MIKNKNFINFILDVVNENIGIDRLSIDYTRYMHSDSENETPVSVEVRNKNNNNKENKNNNKNEIENFFEECWILYPKKEGKGSVSETQKTKLFKLGEEFA